MGAVMKRFVLTTAALLACAGGSAGAADLPVKAAPAPADYSFTGCHIGANGGGKWGFERGTLYLAPATGPAGPTPAAASTFDTSQTAAGTAMGGGQIGCDYQMGYGVYGIEADGDWQHYGDQTTLAPGELVSFTTKWEASVRGRAGYASDRVLIYATGGVSWTSMNVLTNFAPYSAGGVAFPGTLASDQQTLWGPTGGAGIEFLVTRNLIVGVEARYTIYQGQIFNSGSIATAGLPPAGPFTFASATTPVRLATAEIMARVNWKFDWLGPVVAKY
jgi:outer membrane immunogenic protein